MHRPLTHLVLAAALLLGQWLSAAHTPDDVLTPGAAHACAVCVYSHASGTGALPVMAALQIPVAALASAAPAARHPVAVALRYHPIRGPPALLA